MNKLMTLLLLVTFTSCNKIDKIRGKLIGLIGGDGGGEKVTTIAPEVRMPALPELAESSTSSEVYNKNLPIYAQGDRFNKLSREEQLRYHQGFLQELSNLVRMKSLNENELNQHLNNLLQGGSREGIYRAMVNNENWFRMESYEEPISSQVISFVQVLGNDYLGIEYQENSLSRANIFMVKRIITNRVLDLLQAFTLEADKLHSWYAHYSSFLAQNSCISSKNKIRSVKNVMPHYKWAQEVPFGHIQAELILKTHECLNTLGQI